MAYRSFWSLTPGPWALCLSLWGKSSNDHVHNAHLSPCDVGSRIHPPTTLQRNFRSHLQSAKLTPKKSTFKAAEKPTPQFLNSDMQKTLTQRHSPLSAEVSVSGSGSDSGKCVFSELNTWFHWKRKARESDQLYFHFSENEINLSRSLWNTYTYTNTSTHTRCATFYINQNLNYFI